MFTLISTFFLSENALKLAKWQELKQEHCLWAYQKQDLIHEFVFLLIMDVFTTKKPSVKYTKRERILMYGLLWHEKSYKFVWVFTANETVWRKVIIT